MEGTGRLIHPVPVRASARCRCWIVQRPSCWSCGRSSANCCWKDTSSKKMSSMGMSSGFPTCCLNSARSWICDPTFHTRSATGNRRDPHRAWRRRFPIRPARIAPRWPKCGHPCWCQRRRMIPSMTNCCSKWSWGWKNSCFAPLRRRRMPATGRLIQDV